MYQQARRRSCRCPFCRGAHSTQSQEAGHHGDEGQRASRSGKKGRRRWPSPTCPRGRHACLPLRPGAGLLGGRPLLSRTRERRQGREGDRGWRGAAMPIRRLDPRRWRTAPLPQSAGIVLEQAGRPTGEEPPQVEPGSRARSAGLPVRHEVPGDWGRQDREIRFTAPDGCPGTPRARASCGRVCVRRRCHSSARPGRHSTQRSRRCPWGSLLTCHEEPGVSKRRLMHTPAPRRGTGLVLAVVEEDASRRGVGQRTAR